MNNRNDDHNNRPTVLMSEDITNQPTRLIDDTTNEDLRAGSTLPPTRIVGGGDPARAPTQPSLRQPEGGDAAGSEPVTAPDPDATRLPPNPHTSGAQPGYVAATRFVMPGQDPLAAPPLAGAAAPGASPAGQPLAEKPIVGWLVVLKGPGRGAFRPLYYGNNSIGRSHTQAVSLPYDDLGISAEEQGYIRYNPKDRTFTYIPNLSKTNLVMVNDDPPMTPTVLKAHDFIVMGSTTLQFIPYCGSHFDWNDPI